MASSPYYNHGWLLRALGISLLLHVIFLLQPGFDGPSDPGGNPRSLLAMLRPKADTASVSPGVVAHAAGEPRSRAPSQAASVPEATSSAAIKGSQDGAKEAPAATATPTTSDVGTTAAVGGQNSDVEFAEDKKAFLLAIWAEARRLKKYPPRAFAAGWTGKVEILIPVASGGVVQPVRLHRSSGYKELDEAAMAFVSLALKRTPVPETLRNRNFDLELPFVFNIENE